MIPAWMFDPSRCAGMALGTPQASVAALEEMSIILGELGFDGPVAAILARSQEDADETEAMVPPNPSPDRAAVAAPVGGALRGGAGSGGARRRHRSARPAAAGGRAADAGERR